VFSASTRRVLTALLLAAGLAAGAAADIKIPPVPGQWVTDTAGFLSERTVQILNDDLRSFENSSGYQVLVYVGRTTDGYPIEDFAVKAFQAWKPGRKGLDDGLVLFIMAEDRKIRIEVGYGLEDKVPDALAGRIVNDILVPRIRAGDNDGAVLGGVQELKRAISPATVSEPAQEPIRGRRSSPVNSVLIIIGIIVFLIILITNPSFALWLLFNMFTGGRGGGGGFGGGGGGFSGGGGRSGGGGASGGW
jgi:uncharacterized protein